MTMDSLQRTRTSTALVIALAIAAFALPAAAEAAKPPKRFEAVTLSRYLMARVQPTINSRGATHLWTNTGFSNRRAVYPVLAHRMTDGSEWLKVQTIRGRKNIGVWVPRWATRRVWLRYLVQVDLSSRVARIYRDGKTVKRVRVVVGAPGTPTPRGHFYVVDRMHLHVGWSLGGWALATSAFSNVLTDFDGGSGEIAMHTRGALAAPVGTAASHGCIRFNNGDMNWLATHLPNGTPIWVQA
jgi:lipoprotein-anchoring transpeptidase ErfK/SrfK